MSKYWYVLFIMFINISGIASQTIPNIILPEKPNDPIKVKVSSSLTKANKLGYADLSVYVSNETKSYIKIIPIQGKHLREEDNLLFKPFFPFEKGLSYTLKCKILNSDTFTYLPFQIGEKEKVDLAKVLSIFPSANLWPENLLRFYIYFQTPMKQEEALKHIQLIDEKGNSDSNAFMKFKEELWSNDGKRLTILFDPGRIKRGVSTNSIHGPSLEKGKSYHLSISGDWQDVYGNSLLEKTKKEIKVTAACREKIETENWILKKPVSSSQESLWLGFDRIMDHALLQSMVLIKDASENIVEGYWEILDNEQGMQFVPQLKWKEGSCKIELDARLEDVSGNNLQNLLDHIIMDPGNTEIFQFLEFKIL